ncbi:3-hydroxy-3-methylglutaryl-coenzyme A reductase [Orchesella cincta]|uniref:3-hydroxy-3-methylglutaryl-coenzyme A reductase n=1 Tax=Orchesella cincta TaxID=48709 RepID=A0A1D2NB19_ORCCI|nr:3-hydroxy-3-methylglutaryl-coenzyme A reductase [Orchesella cincta]
MTITSIFPFIGSIIFSYLAHLLPEEFDKIPYEQFPVNQVEEITDDFANKLLYDNFREVLFYFLLILDLPRACFLPVLHSKVQNVQNGTCSSSIIQGVKILAPWLTMDTVIECIVLLLGYYSGIPRLEALCTFVCLSVLINYVVVLQYSQ